MLLNILLFVVMAGMEQTNKEGLQRLNDALALDPVAVGLHGAPTGWFEGGDGKGGFEGEGAVFGQRVAINSGGVWTLLTYQFVHAGFLHILGNMLVLWVFGPAVEDRFGRWGFALFYLLGGVLAGLMHGVFSAHPVIGASGAVAAVTGSFLVLFPRTHVKLLMFFVYVGVFELPAWLFIALAVVKDLWGLGTHGEGVAFLAHIGGYLFGFCTSMLLLLGKALPDEDWSLLAVFRQHRRRAEFKRLASEADREWKGRIEKPATPAASPAEPADVERPRHPGRGVEERVLWQRMDASEAQALSEQESLRLAGLRSTLAERVAAGDAAGASSAFRVLLKEERGTGNGRIGGNRRTLADAGNLFASAGRHADAADAYEAFLSSLRGLTDPEEGRIRLMLALVAQRYLKDPKRATAALAGIKSEFSDPELHALADSLRQELKAGR